MTDSETVLVADINVRERFHLPNRDNPDEPRCHRKKVVRGGFRKRDRDRLPEKFELCKYCDPEHTIERQGCPEGGTIASKLEDADPDELVTDGGSDTYASGTYRPPCREEANTTPYAASEDLERRVCPQCRYYFDCGKDSDRVFCSLACERRYGESNELIADGGTVEDDSEHIITITKVLKHRGDVSDPDRLLGEKEHVNLHGHERRVGTALDVVEELRCSYECSCGERFLKDHTAADHLRENRSLRTGTEHGGQR